MITFLERTQLGIYLKCHYIVHYISYIILITIYNTQVRFLDETSFEPYSVSTEVFSLLFYSDVVSNFYYSLHEKFIYKVSFDYSAVVFMDNQIQHFEKFYTELLSTKWKNTCSKTAKKPLNPQEYSESCKTSKMMNFTKIVDG